MNSQLALIYLLQGELQININSLLSNPNDRKSISSYHSNDRDEVRRAYLQKVSCQPETHVFPQIKMSNYMRCFNESRPLL